MNIIMRDAEFSRSRVASSFPLRLIRAARYCIVQPRTYRPQLAVVLEECRCEYLA